ncbi:MAG TPA: LPS assembly lipoprotein LptE [Chitinophagaceae bacterium]|nr:LPS assembly lipoprotein LptE [Chitinophagaceae bacterium]
MRATKKIFLFSFLSCAYCLLLFTINGCHVSYSLHDVSIPPEIKTVKVNFIENRARYVNPQLSQSLTDKLRQKIVGQTRLTQTNGDNADWEVSGYVNDYSVSTSGISQQQTSLNRLNVSVHISILKRKDNDQQEFDVTHSFDFSANLTLQAAESQLNESIIRDMTDEIFNHIFSNW